MSKADAAPDALVQKRHKQLLASLQEDQVWADGLIAFLGDQVRPFIDQPIKFHPLFVDICGRFVTYMQGVRDHSTGQHAAVVMKFVADELVSIVDNTWRDFVNSLIALNGCNESCDLNIEDATLGIFSTPDDFIHFMLFPSQVALEFAKCYLAGSNRVAIDNYENATVRLSSNPDCFQKFANLFWAANPRYVNQCWVTVFDQLSQLGLQAAVPDETLSFDSELLRPFAMKTVLLAPGGRGGGSANTAAAAAAANQTGTGGGDGAAPLIEYESISQVRAGWVTGVEPPNSLVQCFVQELESVLFAQVLGYPRQLKPCVQRTKATPKARAKQATH